MVIMCAQLSFIDYGQYSWHTCMWNMTIVYKWFVCCCTWSLLHQYETFVSSQQRKSHELYYLLVMYMYQLYLVCTPVIFHVDILKVSLKDVDLWLIFNNNLTLTAHTKICLQIKLFYLWLGYPHYCQIWKLLYVNIRLKENG